jgi:hypothetical protein
MNLRFEWGGRWGRRLAEGWRAWRRRRYWTSERQLDYLRTLLQADHRWLAHYKTADALTTRYLAALAPDWYSRVHADACCFRREIGLEPLTALSALNSTAVRKPPNGPVEPAAQRSAQPGVRHADNEMTI